MSARAMAWAWEQQLAPAPKLLLMAIADAAGPNGAWVFGAQKEMASMTGMGERTVRRHLEALEAEGLITRCAQYDAGARVADRITLPLVTRDVPAKMAGTETPADHEVIPANLTTGQNGRAHSSTTDVFTNGTSTKKKDVPGQNGRGVLAVPDVDPSMLEDADALLTNKRKVDGKLVTEAEMLRAAAALSEFNRLMDADFGLGANLTAIVMRVRDRPSWDAAKHVRLVQSACRIQWWRKKGSQRRATPAVIYGNPQVFEQVAQDARDEAAGRELVEDTDLRNHLYNGVPWDQLTRAQQENAREALTMGIKPWERRPDPVPLPRNGSVQSFTADNFAAA